MPHKINDIDKFGNCIYCHRHLVHNKVIGGKVIGVLDPEASDSFFKLNNGSVLVVPICKTCKATVNLDDPTVQSSILDEVNNGWQLEINHMKAHKEYFPDFSSDKEADLVSLYSSLNIVSHEAHHKVGG